jgi:hypothetical protein
MQQAREELRCVVGFSVADEIDKLDRLKKSGAITDQEFTRLRAKLTQYWCSHSRLSEPDVRGAVANIDKARARYEGE